MHERWNEYIFLPSFLATRCLSMENECICSATMKSIHTTFLRSCIYMQEKSRHVYSVEIKSSWLIGFKLIYISKHFIVMSSCRAHGVEVEKLSNSLSFASSHSIRQTSFTANSRDLQQQVYRVKDFRQTIFPRQIKINVKSNSLKSAECNED